MSALSFFTPFASEIGCRLLQSDPATLERLGELDGRVIALDFESTDITLYMFPTPAGIRLRSEWDGEVDVHMKGTPSELLKMGMAGKAPVTPGKINIKLEGDLHVGQQFKKILDDMQIDWEELLSQHIGDTAAYHTSKFLRGAHKRVRDAVNTTVRNSSEYLRYEAEILPADWRVEEFIDDVDRVRNDVDRMAMRVERLIRNQSQ
ncbi:MAG: SCP2 sterol-binding domain-containing protein [Pseudomonadota bacterium]|nr:SCP2 sterol-binding domain-containing protein [Pseudomonadota bacterium]